MSICLDENCTCLHSRLLDCMKKQENNEAESLLQKLDNLRDLTDSSGLTLVHHAVAYQNASIVHHLISLGCDVDAQDPRGITPLMMALVIGDVVVIGVLLINNADPCTAICVMPFVVRNSVVTSLGFERKKYRFVLKMFFDRLWAVVLSDTARVLQLLINADDYVKLAAMVFGNVELMSFMLQTNYVIDYCEPERGYTALHYAIVFARMENAKMLIRCGADVNTVDKTDRSPLHYYSVDCEGEDEYSAVLWYLLRCTNCSSVQFTNLKHLIVNGNKQTVKAVLRSDIDVNKYVGDKVSIPYLLVDNRNTDVLEVFDEIDMKFDVNARTSSGDTALMAAVEKKCLKKVEFLLDHGADNLDSALFYSIMISNLIHKGSRNIDAKMFELLLLYGANPQAVNRRGNTVLFSLQHYGVAYEHSRVIIAHLALLGSLDESPLTDYTRQEIHPHSLLKDHFDVCTQQLEKMKTIKVYGEMTLHKLLTVKEGKLVDYTQNWQLVVAFTSIIDNVRNLEPYYYNALFKRISKAINRNRLALKAAFIIEGLTGLSRDAYGHIVHRIISYVDLQDLRNLCKIEYIIVTTK